MSAIRIATLLLAAASLVILGFLWFGGLRRLDVPQKAAVRDVPGGDQEIAWIDAATSTSAWQRFVAAIHQARADHPELQVTINDTNASPPFTTTIPEVALTARHSSQRLWIRWYKLTGSIGMDQWVTALTQRSPPPLAIIGGGSSDRARDLALALQSTATQLSSSPLLLITTATADKVILGEEPQERDLMEVYPGRSFRFCFTNGQMADAMIDFIWSGAHLRPDPGRVYLVKWKDDPYSEDLGERFRDVFEKRQGGASAPSYRFWITNIPYSVGGFQQPNRREAEAAEKFLDELVMQPDQKRPLLLLPATSQPVRRFLRALVRLAPAEVSRFVVATGDAIPFNDIYRDRHVNWPIQDLPFRLVLFCHRNPVHDEPEGRSSGNAPHTSSGTEDLLLYADIAAAALESAYDGTRLTEDANEMARRLRTGPQPRFDARGNRISGKGEHVVYLQPLVENGRVMPQSTIQVWQAHGIPTRRWVLEKSLTVDYRENTPAVPPFGRGELGGWERADAAEER